MRGGLSEGCPIASQIRHTCELVLKEITDCLERGETVKLSSFGSFVVRKKGQRIGRNPKTNEPVPISARRVMVFKPSATLKLRINRGPQWRQRGRQSSATNDQTREV
jgi:integration host factor subunit alpha